MVFTAFVELVTAIFALIGDGIEILMKPPIVWFVALGFAGAVVATAKQIVPRKKAK